MKFLSYCVVACEQALLGEWEVGVGYFSLLLPPTPREMARRLIVWVSLKCLPNIYLNSLTEELLTKLFDSMGHLVIIMKFWSSACVNGDREPHSVQYNKCPFKFLVHDP